jgi:hypothetical protein
MWNTKKQQPRRTSLNKFNSCSIWASGLGVSKKTEKPIKLRKPEKKTEPKKKPIKILKKTTGSISVL